MGTKWTLEDLQRLANNGVKVEGLTPVVQPKKKKQSRKEARQLFEMKQWLTILGIKFTPEYRFHEFRKFRFDIALEDHKIAFEYEGIFSSKSRHTTAKGYTRDSDKYNLAQTMGWRVFRYTSLNYKNFLSDVKTLLEI